MIRPAILSLVALSTCLPASPVLAAGNCYSKDNGPFMSCYEGGNKIDVKPPFKDGEGNYYSWDYDSGSYCYENETGAQRCMQDWEVSSLLCSKTREGQLLCE